MHALDLCIVGLFVLYAVWAGLRSRKVASQNLEEYFLAGRTLTGWRAGISMAATQFASDTPLLVTGLIAMAGIFSLWRLWIYALAFLMMGFILAPCWRRARVLTDAELTELRYGQRVAVWLRGFKAIYLGTIFNCTVLAMVLLAAARIAEPFLLWNEWLPAWLFNPVVDLVQAFGMPLTIKTGNAMWVLSANNLISILSIALLTTFYSATGGLRSVVRTDVVQFVVAMLGTACYAGYVVHALGGLDAIPARLHEAFARGGPGGITPSQILAFDPSHAKDAGFAILAVFAIQWIAQMNADGTGYLAQRSMACRTDKDAKQAAVVFTVAQVLLRSLLWLPIGLGLLLIFPPNPDMPLSLLSADREATFVSGIAQLLPVGVQGLMLTGLIAALASTVDTHLNWGASYWTNDLYKRIFCGAWLKRSPSGRELVWVARGSNVLILLLALFIMTRLSSIAVAWQTSLLLGAGLGVLLVLRWLWWRITAWGEIASIAASLILAPVLIKNIPAEQEALRLLIIAVGATTAGVFVSLLSSGKNKPALCEFFSKVRPPGFWGPVARMLGDFSYDGPRRLGRGILATALAAFSIFCLLTGIGSWMVQSPAPVWFPKQGLWIATLLVLGVALWPIWWRLGFKDKS